MCEGAGIQSRAVVADCTLSLDLLVARFAGCLMMDGKACANQLGAGLNPKHAEETFAERDK